MNSISFFLDLLWSKKANIQPKGINIIH